MTTTLPRPLGALVQDDGVLFRLWAPHAASIDLVLEEQKLLPLDGTGDGYFERFVPGLGAGTLYRYRKDGSDLFPDPASRFQPEGVHGPSMVVNPSAYAWGDEGWLNVPQERWVFYELHVGTFTPEGTFRGIIDRLDYLQDLGITCIELMPVADWPGRWNWGYDHAALYAPSRAYGTPDDLRALVDAAHQKGLAVFLDVIYNHLGPDGAYVAAFAPFFTDKHHTPWGQAINFDDAHSAGVRNFFFDNACYWLREFHIDGFRLDATHAIIDDNTPHFLAELSAVVEQFGEEVAETERGGNGEREKRGETERRREEETENRGVNQQLAPSPPLPLSPSPSHLFAHSFPAPRRYLIAEDPRNINTMLHPREHGGLGLDAIWTDDLHHQIRNMTVGDTEGYYADYARSTAAELAITIRQGWYFDGRPSPTKGTPRGTPAEGIRLEQCVVAIQNHDQVGNRPTGERLHHQIPLPVYRATSALLLFAPETPLLFMGQEWAASSPFQFFTDHHEELGRLVTNGRRDEFKDFSGFDGDVPDPQDPSTFKRSRLDWAEPAEPIHARTLTLYRDLLRLRPSLRGTVEAVAHGSHALTVRRGDRYLLVALANGASVPLPNGTQPVWHSEQSAYTHDPQPPRVEQDAVHFIVAGAMVVGGGDSESRPYRAVGDVTDSPLSF